MALRKTIAVLIFPWLLAAPSRAADGAFAANLGAMGGAGAAASEDNAALATNPAVIALHQRYDLHGHVEFAPDTNTEWALSAVDGKTSDWLVMGLLYQGDRAHPELRMSELPGWTEPGVVPTNIKRHHDFTLAAATHAFRRRLSIGMSGVLSMYNHDRQGQGTTGNMDFGLAAHASRWLVLGAAGRNLLPIEGVGEFPLTAVGGFRVHGQAGALAADVEWEDAATVPWSLCGGVERRVGRVPVVRAGWRWEGPERSHRFTTGFGAQGPEGSLDFGALIPVGPDEPTLGSTTWMFSMQLVAPTMDDPTL